MTRTGTSLHWREQIERTLAAHGGGVFGYTWTNENACLFFVLNGIQCAFQVSMPPRNDPRFTLTPARRFEVTPERAAESYEREVRDRWRLLAELVEAKFSAVDAGIVTADQEFRAYMLTHALMLAPITEDPDAS